MNENEKRSLEKDIERYLYEYPSLRSDENTFEIVAESMITDGVLYWDSEDEAREVMDIISKKLIKVNNSKLESIEQMLRAYDIDLNDLYNVSEYYNMNGFNGNENDFEHIIKSNILLCLKQYMDYRDLDYSKKKERQKILSRIFK